MGCVINYIWNIHLKHCSAHAPLFPSELVQFLYQILQLPVFLLECSKASLVILSSDAEEKRDYDNLAKLSLSVNLICPHQD